jgi:hypothetical protein
VEATLADLALMPCSIRGPFAVPILLSDCLPAGPALPVAIDTARTGPNCGPRITARTTGPFAERTAAVGAGLAAGTARASGPPPASLSGDVQAAAPTPATATTSAIPPEFPP